jgi:AraC-like DNA-binding protein
MRIELEKISPISADTSFNWLINPKLNDFFMWHFHPEFELVFIEAEAGTRHVGEHIARFEESDLVFIGSNIPHLNFDYGIKTNYEKTVLHIQPNFLENAFLNTPELKAIQNLFESSKLGIAFGSDTKKRVGEQFKNIHQLPYFEQFLSVLQVLKILAEATDMVLLHSEVPKNQYNRREQERLKKIYSFIDEYYQRKIEIQEIAQVSNLSDAAFCRYFKKMTKLTFTEFLNHYRINQAKRLLMLDKNVSETCFECGFESLSYFNRIFKKITGENPLAFKKKF